MKITPRYDTGPIIRLDGPPSAVRTPLLRQRRRFARQLSTFTPDQWAAASRCEGWRVQDVVAHLTSTDQFWHFAVASGLAGTPTRMLESFDPKAVPAALRVALDQATVFTLAYDGATDTWKAEVAIDQSIANEEAA